MRRMILSGVLLVLAMCVASAEVSLDVRMYAGVEITGEVGSRYSIKASSDPGPSGEWTEIGVIELPESPWVFIDYDSPFGSKRFYRASLVDDGDTLSDMALIPGGEFEMGEDSLVRTVHVSAFYMDRTEVTKALWDEVYEWAIQNGYTFDYQAKGKAPFHPAYEMSWHDALRWCNARSEKEGRVPAYYTSAAQVEVLRKAGWVDMRNDWVKWDSNGYRLPTEAEWEKAARGRIKGKSFPAGEELLSHDRANFKSSPDDPFDNSQTHGHHPSFQDGATPYTSPVSWFDANGYGLYDMAGNASEMCWDRFDPDYYQASNNTSDPRGPETNEDGMRVTRGGNWNSEAQYCRVAVRAADNFDAVGFRTVISAE